MSTEFATKRLHLAIFLHASERLPFLRAEPSGDGKLSFIFRDDERAGPQLELDFERGAAVSARDLFSSQTFLRRQMTQTENSNIGESSHASTHR
ncbi:MAG: hypothetical protein ACYDCG_20655 [Candidatus Acidiferrales bacterium]